MSYPNTAINKKLEIFSSQILQRFFETSVTSFITNRRYEGQIRGKGTIVDIPMLEENVDWITYTGADMVADEEGELNAQLICDQAKSYYFGMKNTDTLESYIKDKDSAVRSRLASRLKEIVDSYVLGFYTKVAAGNRVGTDEATGTVAVAATTGVVTGTGTNFTADMIGKGFTCDGLVDANGKPKFYRVKAVASTTSMTIVDDFYDKAEAYTGGVIGATAAFVVEAVTAIQVTKDTIYAKTLEVVGKLRQKGVPIDNAFGVVPNAIGNLYRQANVLTLAVSELVQDVIRKGAIGKVAGAMIFENEQVHGNNADGYHTLFGIPDAITLATAMTDQGSEPWIGNFGTKFKGLEVYGAKVPDVHKVALAEGFFKL